MQYVSVAMALSVKNPFKKSMLTNKAFVVNVVLVMTYGLYVIVAPDRWSKRVFGVRTVCEL